jgi:hypothetical protein
MGMKQRRCPRCKKLRLKEEGYNKRAMKFLPNNVINYLTINIWMIMPGYDRPVCGRCVEAMEREVKVAHKSDVQEGHCEECGCSYLACVCYK